jgi:hypothetical protein
MGDIDCLKTCAECNRHVRCGERACPFCGAAMTHFMRAPEYRIKTRLGRGATFSLGAALGAIGFAVGCSSDDAPQPVYGAACNPPSCTFPSAGTGGSAVAVGGTGGATTGGGAGGTTAGGGGAAGSDRGGGAGALSEGGAAGAEEPSDGGAAGQQ